MAAKVAKIAGDGVRDAEAAASAPGAGRSAIDAGFERWLDNQLHRLYDPVLNETLPDDIARLIEQFAQKSPGDKKGGEGDPTG